MPIVLSEADSFDASVTVPAGGDPRTAASVDGAFQSLTNRTKNLRKGVPGIAASYDIIVPAATTNVMFSVGYGGQLSWVFQTSVASAVQLFFPLSRLPPFGTITAVAALVNGQNPIAIAAAGAAHHAALPATKPTLQLFRADPTSGAAGNGTQIGATITDPSASVALYEVPHYISLTGLTEVIDTTKVYTAIVSGETGANSQVNDFTIVHFKITLAP
jgi:hypothetical protein